MARRSDVKQIIFQVWEANLDWLPKQIKEEVQKILGPRRSKNYTYPGLRLVQSYIKGFKDNIGRLGDEDKPWSVAASVHYGLPAEVTKDLFDIWRYSLAIDRPITIRQAKWIVYIRNLFQSISTGNSHSDKVNRNLWLIRQSWLYSTLERASRIMGEKYFDTANLDASFMPSWELATVLKLGKVSSIDYSREALNKLEKHGTSLTSPSVSVKSVEQAVWHSVRAEPPQHMEVMAYGSTDEVLSEEYDLVAAYWLTNLSKGPRWNDLPSRPGIHEYYQERRRLREQGHFVPDSGGFPDDSMYSRQLAIREKLFDWVKTDSKRRELLLTIRTGSVMETWSLMTKTDLPGESTPPFNATLLKTVGYEVTAEEMGSWLKLHELELQARHIGFNHVPSEVQERFIHDEQTYNDKEILGNADSEFTANEGGKQ